jgi:hypothetical protein
MSQLFFEPTTKLALCPSIPGAITRRMNCTFITCSCYHRQSWLASPQRRDLFLAVFEEVRNRYGFVVVGYVVMPDHGAGSGARTGAVAVEQLPELCFRRRGRGTNQ